MVLRTTAAFTLRDIIILIMTVTNIINLISLKGVIVMKIHIVIDNVLILSIIIAFVELIIFK